MFNKIILDFDSTIIKCEALEVLAEICLQNNPQKKMILKKITEITNQGMAGKLSFRESLAKRLELLAISKSSVNKLVEKLEKQFSDSFLANIALFRKRQEQIIVISGGFTDFIIPVLESVKLENVKVFANTFIYNKAGSVIGFDKRNPLSKSKGKAMIVADLKLKDVCVIGDGYSDYEIKAQGYAEEFYAFVENVYRMEVVVEADKVLKSFHELFQTEKILLK